MTKIQLLTEGRAATSDVNRRDPRGAIEVFDFEKNWHLVRPHLPAAERALARGLNKFFVRQAEECINEGLGPNGWQIRYDKRKGPWSYGSPDYWPLEIIRRTNEAIATGEFNWEPPRDDEDQVTAQQKCDAYAQFSRRFAPQPDTYQWYQLWGACHWLVPWQLKLGRLIFPHLHWMAVRGELHSFAGGLEGNRPRMIFDILFFQTLSAAELIDWVNEKAPAAA